MIDNFSGTFLSNFFYVKVMFDGEEYPSVEHAYQAAKTDDLRMRRIIREKGTAGEAKKLGALLGLRPGWHQEREGIMRSLLEQKFSKGLLRKWLLSTGDQELVEGELVGGYVLGGL